MQIYTTNAKLSDFYRFSFSGLLGVVRRPFYWKDFLEQMEYSGVGSIGIVILLSLFAGMALSLQISAELSTLGLQMYTGRVVGISIISEISPVLMAVVYAGRAGSGMASELGSMALGHQIDILRAFGIDPVKKLVTPRIVSALVMLPSLTIIGDAAALSGGYYIQSVLFHQSSIVYWNSVEMTLLDRYLLPGFVKPVIFGLLISAISTYAGFASSGGAQGVKRATTSAFALSIIAIIVSDFFLTKLILLVLRSSV